MDFLSNIIRPRPALRKDAEKLADSIGKNKLKQSSVSFHGEAPLKRTGTGYEFWQFKPYSAGEEVRNIDWRASAKSEQILIREREFMAHRILNICPLNSDSLKFSSGGNHEKSYSVSLICLASGIWAARNGYQIKFYGSSTTPDELEILLPINKDQTVDGSSKGETLLLCSDFIEDFGEIKRILDTIEHQKTVIIQCLDPAEIELPYRGRVAFNCDQEQITLDASHSLAEQYQASIQQHIDKLKTYAEERLWFYGLFRSDQFPEVLFKEMMEYLEVKK